MISLRTSKRLGEVFIKLPVREAGLLILQTLTELRIRKVNFSS